MIDPSQCVLYSIRIAPVPIVGTQDSYGLTTKLASQACFFGMKSSILFSILVFFFKKKLLFYLDLNSLCKRMNIVPFTEFHQCWQFFFCHICFISYLPFFFFFSSLNCLKIGCRHNTTCISFNIYLLRTRAFFCIITVLFSHLKIEHQSILQIYSPFSNFSNCSIIPFFNFFVLIWNPFEDQALHFVFMLTEKSSSFFFWQISWYWHSLECSLIWMCEILSPLLHSE